MPYMQRALAKKRVMTNLEKHLETLAHRLDDRLFEDDGTLKTTADRTEAMLSIFNSVAVIILANQDYPLDRECEDND